MKHRLISTAYWAAYFGAAIATATVVYACSDDGETSNPATTTNGSGQAGSGNDNFGGMGQGGGTGGACENLDIEPNLDTLPADIIFIIDNSGSMSNEIAQVESNISNNFAQIIGMSNVDYQVIMLAAHGTHNSGDFVKSVCIGPPLSNTTDCSGEPGDTPQFHHYDLGGCPVGSGGCPDGVQSLDSMCIVLDTFNGSNGGGELDEHGLHPEGWSKWLRTDAIKVFVEITDDGILCTWDGTTFNDMDDAAIGETTAALWDARLLMLSPLQFGTPENRKYLFYSLAGMTANPNNPMEPYQPYDPIMDAMNCTGAFSPGTGYQWLSRGTKALRFPVCSTNYDAIFQDIAAGVIKGSALPCDFDLPTPDNGQEPDLNSVTIIYTPGEVPGPAEGFEQVPSEAACGALDNAFWIDDTVVPPRVHLCPQACEKVDDDTLANINVRFQCGGVD